MVHGEAWTVKELFTYPNEYVYWSIQIVMYPFMTGLVAGAFVLSSLYHVFGIRELKDIARFSLVLSFALLLAAPIPLVFHLQQPLRAMNVFLTPHFTSAIAAFGIVFSCYAMIVASEIWFLYRPYFVQTALTLRANRQRTLLQTMLYALYTVLTLGAYDLSEDARHTDERAVKVLAASGIPVACFLHGYAGFIFGSVKANALWMTPLMPVIFIMSAIVSGIALSMLVYIAVTRVRDGRQAGDGIPTASPDRVAAELGVIRMTTRYLVLFMTLAVSLELLDLVFRSYTAVKTWDALRSVIYGRDFVDIFVLQYGIGGVLPFVLLLLPRLTVRRTVVALLMVLVGVFMMRWNVVIGGQAFSLTLNGYMHYRLPILPTSVEAFKEGLCGAMVVGAMPFVLFWAFSKVIPVFGYEAESAADAPEMAAVGRSAPVSR